MDMGCKWSKVRESAFMTFGIQTHLYDRDGIFTTADFLNGWETKTLKQRCKRIFIYFQTSTVKLPKRSSSLTHQLTNLEVPQMAANL
jgi:hypothetical protein